MLPKGAGRHDWATIKAFFVAQGSGRAPGRQFHTLLSPKGAGRHDWATLKAFFVTQEHLFTVHGDSAKKRCGATRPVTLRKIPFLFLCDGRRSPAVQRL